MQRARPAAACDCVSETARTVHRIQRAAASGPPEQCTAAAAAPPGSGTGGTSSNTSTSSSSNGTGGGGVLQRPPLPPPPPPPTTTAAAALDDVLGEGRSLVRDWERMNGCVNAAAHVDGDHATLQAMIGAVDNLVGLYEALGRAARLFAATMTTATAAGGTAVRLPHEQGQQQQQQQNQGSSSRDGRGGGENSPREWSSYASEACTPDTSVGGHFGTSLLMTTPSRGGGGGGGGFLAAAAASSSSSDLHGAQPPAAYLGTHRLDDEEAVLVAREAIRHSVILLGELLHDIEKDFGEEMEESRCHDADAVAATLEAGSKVSARLLRLLGRINSSSERA